MLQRATTGASGGGGTYVETVVTTSTPYVIQNVTTGVFFIKNSSYGANASLRTAIEDGAVKENFKGAGDIKADYDATTHTLTFSNAGSTFGGTHTLYGYYS